jgi:hypothetical protein
MPETQATVLSPVGMACACVRTGTMKHATVDPSLSERQHGTEGRKR